MEPQDYPYAPVISRAARIRSLAAMDLLIIVSTIFAALVAALLADIEAVATLVGLASTPVPARRLVLAEARRRPRGARLSRRVP